MDAFGHEIILGEDLLPQVAVKCMICDNFVALNHRDAQGICLYVCSECQDAIKWLKKFKEEKENDL